MITCDEPEVPVGSYVIGYDFNIHSSIEYHCEPGHLLIGEAVLQCGATGEWTGSIPNCECMFHRIILHEFSQKIVSLEMSLFHHSIMNR